MQNVNLLFLVIIWFGTLQTSLFGQSSKIEFTADNFENKIFSYSPIQKENVSSKDFDRGIFILDIAKSAAKNRNMEFIYKDYWNFLMAFIYFDEPQNHLDLVFQKAIDNNSQAICNMINTFGDRTVERLTVAVPDLFLPFYGDCKFEEKVEEVFDPKSYATKNGFDLELINLVHQIAEDDQKFRKVEGEVDWSKQTPLDKKNMQLIDSLYNNKHTYIGKSMVGKELASTMWTVIQHSNIKTMEKYLPIMHAAVKKGELSAGTIKLTIDRIYCDKYNYQPFGSQFGNGCELSSKEVREKVQKQYGFK